MEITLRGQPILTMHEFKHSKTHTALLQCGHMLIDDRPAVCRYAMPLVTVGAASLLASLLPWRVDPSHFTLYFLAVVVSAWYGGVGAGLLSTVLSALALDYYFISPIYSIEMDAHALVRLCVFLSVSIITNILTNARRRAESALRQAHAELEDRVKERTAELAQTNSALREEISERQKLEKELYRVQHQIGRVERLATLGRMTGTVAHDLGTPLNSVLGYAQLLAQEDLPERARRRLAIIETQIHRMGEIIQNYLAYTRGNPPQEIISVNDLIRDTLLLLQPVFKQRDVQVGAQLDESLPAVIGDGNSIQRVLINLLDNAVDACEQRGSVMLRTYAAENSPQKRQGVVIECADSGTGIEAEILPKVFELFVTTKAPGKGTGMGLVICQEIVRAHGGDINIKSDPSKGTVVTVFLPVNVNSQSAADAEERHAHPHTDS